MNYFFKLLLAASIGLLISGCTEKVNDDTLTPLVDLIETEGWYEDAFIRVVSKDISQAAIFNNFTHPKMILKRANDEFIYTLELDGQIKKHPYYVADCIDFDPQNKEKPIHFCEFIYMSISQYDFEIVQIEYGEYIDGAITSQNRVGELRGGEDLDTVVDFILSRASDYSCRDSYNLFAPNSNTFVRAMLELSGFYTLYEERNGEAFRLGGSALGQASWENCPLN